MPDGVDYSSGHPGGAALARAGMKFAARYLSHTERKNLTAAEAADLAAHGVSCVVVWETSAQRAGAGRAAGIEDAREARAQAQACGMPAGRPIYFAVDYDAAPAAVRPYFEGVASVLGVAHTGVYGGYRVVADLLNRRAVAWAWQTVAWSGGKWDSRAHIRQYASTTRINGVACDKDTAMRPDYGQWMPGKTPQEEDVPLTAADHKAIAREVVAELTASGPRDVLAGAVLYWLTRAVNPSIALPTGKDVPAVVAHTAELRAAIAANTAATAATVRGALAAGVVTVDVNVNQPSAA